jgi:hypothetical protein
LAEKLSVASASRNVTEVGTVRAAALLLKRFTVRAFRAAAFRLSWHCVLLSANMVWGEQAREAGLISSRLIVAVWEEFPQEAASTALSSLEMTALVAVNCAVVFPAATKTGEDAVSCGLLDEIVTPAPPLGAAGPIETVQVVLPWPVRIGGLQASAATPGSEVVSTKVALMPAKLAVRVAGPSAAAAPALAVKFAEESPAEAVALPGIVTMDGLALSVTVIPPPDAGLVRLTVQVDAPGT